MDEQERHRADAAIGPDWQEPNHARRLQAWHQLDDAKRQRLTALQREGWTERCRPEPEDSTWVEYLLVPPDPRAAKPERIGRWPLKVELDEHNRVRAIREEHGV